MPSQIETRRAQAQRVHVTVDALTVDLDDGRTITTPLAWYPRLMHGTEQERQNHQIIGQGEGVHWPDLDEDLSVEGMLAGLPSAEGPKSLKTWLDQRNASRKTG